MLSISIVTYKFNSQHLVELLQSLAVCCKKLPDGLQLVDIDIIDNGNEASKLIEIISEYKKEFDSINIISTTHNIGYGPAHNLAIDKSKSTYHLILNPDVVLDPECLIEGLNFLHNNKKVVALSPEATDDKRTKLYLCKKYPSIFVLFLRALNINFLNVIFDKYLADYEERNKINENKVANVDIISGCFILCCMSSLKKIRGFDTRYFLYFEDFALCKELTKLGSIQFLPTMKIIHHGGNSSRKGLKHIFMFISSAIKFFNQYGWKII